jgi:hypothetical protein
VPFSATATRISVQIYSPTALPIMRAKLENSGNPGQFVEADQQLAVGWQTLTFDFAAGLTAGGTYDKLTLFPGFSCGVGTEVPTTTVYYIGAIRFLGG